MENTVAETVSADWIDKHAWVVFDRNRLGRLACFFFEELEHLMRHAYAHGQQDMARHCAEEVQKSMGEVATISASNYPRGPVPGRTLVDSGELLDTFTAWAIEAGKEEAEWSS